MTFIIWLHDHQWFVPMVFTFICVSKFIWDALTLTRNELNIETNIIGIMITAKMFAVLSAVLSIWLAYVLFEGVW